MALILKLGAGMSMEIEGHRIEVLKTTKLRIVSHVPIKTFDRDGNLRLDGTKPKEPQA
jgi:hypothetical protein